MSVCRSVAVEARSRAECIMLHRLTAYVVWALQAYLSAVPLGRLLILDLSSSDSIAKRYDGYFGHDWIWTALLSFGGRRGLYGFANAYASNPYTDRAGMPNIVGLGVTGEAIEIIPSQFGLSGSAPSVCSIGTVPLHLCRHGHGSWLALTAHCQRQRLDARVVGATIQSAILDSCDSK